MAEQPITPAQLDALERVVDKVFANLKIDVEFTKHFLDRVNDERNKRQITLRELGELFAKEYKRWGNTIKHMPVDTQAVMKDLSSAINIPFVLNKDEKGKELVAKTVMRKKDFKSPDKALPVESVKEAAIISKSDWAIIPREIRQQLPRNAKDVVSGTIAHYKSDHGRAPTYDELVNELKSRAVGDAVGWHQKQAKIAYNLLKSGSVTEDMHGAKKGSQVKGSEPVPAKRKPTKGGETPHPMRGRLVGENAINESNKGVVVKTVNGYPIHDMGEAYPYKDKRFMIRDPKIDVWASSAPTLRDAVAKANSLSPRQASYPKPSPDELEHEAWRDEQRARLATGEVRRAVRSRRGFGESERIAVDPRRFAEMKQREGWSVYVSRISFLSRDDFNLEFEKDGDEFQIIGKDDRWDLFRGPTLSGRGKQFDNLEDAFQTATAVVDNAGYTPESVMASWENYRDLDEKLVDPREAILQKALNYLDRKVQAGAGRQSLGGYAFDVAREVNLMGIATAKELAAMYRDWKGDSVVTEGWMESNLYYLDEVIREEDDPCWDGYRQLGTKKKKGKEVPNCVPKKGVKEERSFSPNMTPLQKLIQAYGFLIMGNMGMEKQATSEDGQKKLLELVQRMNQDGATFKDIQNPKFEKNRDRILHHIHDMMKYAVPIMKQNMKPEMFARREKQINGVLAAYKEAAKPTN